MELKKFVGDLKMRMNAQMESISMDHPEPLSRTSRNIVCIKSHVSELKQFAIKYKFTGVAEEIDFFKFIKPDFMSQLLYNQRLFKVHLFEAFNDHESKIKLYNKGLHKLQRFMDKNWEFYQYVLSDHNCMDDKYFLRIGANKSMVDNDDRFSTPFDVKLSKILCSQLIREYLLKSLQKLRSNETLDSNSQLTWTGSKTDLVELVYALHISGVFNKSSADLKQIATHFEHVFNVSLGNYYRTFQEIRIRKTGQVNFINELKEGLVKLIREKDS